MTCAWSVFVPRFFWDWDVFWEFQTFLALNIFLHLSIAADILSEAFVKNTIIRISQSMLSFFGDTC